MNQPQLVVETIFKKSQEFYKGIFDEYAEPNAVLITIDWKIGQNDFPVGTLMSRDNINSDMLVSLISQLNKQERRLVQAVLDRLTTLEEKLKNESTQRASGIIKG